MDLEVTSPIAVANALHVKQLGGNTFYYISSICSSFRPDPYDFQLGFEVGFGEWNNGVNKISRINNTGFEIINNVQRAAGLEFGEAVAEALQAISPRTLQNLQNQYYLSTKK